MDGAARPGLRPDVVEAGSAAVVDGHAGPQPDGAAPVNPESGADVDPGQVAPPAPLHLAFEEIYLEGTPTAITDFAFIPGTREFLLLQKGKGDGNFGAAVFHYSLEGDTARLIGGFELDASYDFHDCGLISLAFDPDFANNAYVYFGYCESRDDSVVSRHLFDPTNYALANSSRAVVIRLGEDNAPQAWHNIGSIGFDGEGNLWALVGEKDDSPRAQELSNPLGSVIRVRPRRGVDESGYETVSSNPFVGLAGRDANIVAYGLRSPWRGNLDQRGRLWIGDVGGDFEEVNVLGAFDGQNFGWDQHDGVCTGPCVGVSDPVASWTNALDTWPALEDPDVEPTQRRVVWTGLEYEPVENDPYDGRFDQRMLYGNFCGGGVRSMTLNGEGRVVYDEHAGHMAHATAWRQGADGFVYASAYGNCFTTAYLDGRFVRAVLKD